MTIRTHALALAALMTAGCAAPSTMTATSDPLGLGDAVTTRYQTQALLVNDTAISRIEASSTRPSAWFSTNFLTDGSYHTAWGPADDDTEPSLLVTLTRPVALSALGIKLCDRDITFDVATANTESGFTTIATGLTPDYYAMDYMNLPAGQDAIQVKLTFHVPTNRKLLVCELKLFGDNQAIAAPAAGPAAPDSNSHHFYAEANSYGASWGPFRFREGENEFKLTFKSNVSEAQTVFRGRVRTADGTVVTTWTYDAMKGGFYYARNYSTYGSFSVGADSAWLGRDLYFEVEEATGYYQFILANDNGYITDTVR
jgi:hypothetical protein